MENEIELIYDKLLSIDRKHTEYLKFHKVSLLQMIKIHWKKPFSAHVVGQLPFELASDIEEMFWED